MNRFEDFDNLYNVNNSGDGNTDELKFSNMSTRDYMNMMAQGAYTNQSQSYNQAKNSEYVFGSEHNSYQQTDGNYSNTASYGYNSNAGESTENNDFHQNMNSSVDNFNNSYTSTYSAQDDAMDAGSSKKKNKKSKNRKGNNTSGNTGNLFKKALLLIGSGLIFGIAAGGAFHLVDEFFDDDKYEIEDDFDKDDDLDESANGVTSETFSVGSDYEIPGTAVVTDGVTDSMSLDVSDIAENVMPSVVSITIKSVTEYNAGFFGQTYEYESEGSGSGIIIGENDEELLIVTNNHVVADADTVSVAFIDEQVYEAKVKGTDSDSDLAIIVVDLEDLSDETMSKIKIATIGNSDELKVGEQVVAIGNALGYGQSVTTGIVSAKNRTNETNSTPLIQTDAAINPGNSGGALLNMKGEVVGINSSKMASYDVEGMGYAIPITEVGSIIDSLMSRETREKVAEEERGYLGIACQTINEDASMMYGLPVGALVTEVSEDSGAKKAGIKKNYIITKFDGQSVNSAEGLVGMLEYYKAGETVQVVVMYPDDDEYKEKTVAVTLGKRSE